MGVHSKKKQERHENLTQMQLAIRERQNKQRWQEHIAALVAKADAILDLPAPNCRDYPLDTEGTASYMRAWGRWESECRAVLNALRQSGKRFYRNDWEKEERLTVTTRKAVAA